MSERSGNGNPGQHPGGRRPTEPPPSNFRPLWMLLLFLGGVTALMAVTALVVDRIVFG